MVEYKGVSVFSERSMSERVSVCVWRNGIDFESRTPLLYIKIARYICQ